jgi:predicted ATPase
MRRSSLVTVVGVGGVGKTRLALHAAAGQLPFFRDGAWLCELDAAEDGEAMAQAVLTALRVRPRPGISTASSIVEFLRTRSALLLVVDNCEHLLSAAAALAADILRSCRGVRIVATSLQPLGVSGEQVFGLRPLSLPPPAASMAAAGASDAVSLFVQRATAARRDFSLSPANVAAVGEICRRLDGIPLAIELAAARVAALRPAEIAGLLDERFRLLTRGRVDAAGRHQTLQATVEWSYALLGEAERHVFDCLGVFPASFDAAAAVAVAGTGGLARWDILDSLTALVGKSMVVEEEGLDQTSRYRLLETMRAYARQQLAATGDPGRLRRRHAEFRDVAMPAVPDLLADRAATTRGRHRPRRPPRGRETGQPGLRRTAPSYGSDGLDRRRRPRGGAAARHGGGRDSPKGREPGAVGHGLLWGRRRDMAARRATRRTRRAGTDIPARPVPAEPPGMREDARTGRSARGQPHGWHTHQPRVFGDR